MREPIPKDEYGVFADVNNNILVDSRFVAETFQKRHDNVLKDIRELDCSDPFRLLNFKESVYANAQGKKQPCYFMTPAGFTFLVMGYRGKKAAAFKELYIQRFEEMRSFVQDVLAARLESHMLTDSIQQLHEDPKSYHYVNEYNMINAIALGMSTKKFRELKGIPAGESIRPYLTAKQLSDILTLQHMDAGLALAVADFQERKRILTEFKQNVLDAELKC